MSNTDLGPKMYCAMGTVVDQTHRGSTCLHLDVTDAVNVMLWTTEGGCALWHIFREIDIPGLRHFMQRVYKLSTQVDPINAAHFYLTPDKLAQLKKEKNIEPITIRQHIQQAICIPAGCPHQVFVLCTLMPIHG